MSYKLLIDGQMVDGSTTLDVANPATGEVFATCACAGPTEAEAAVALARKIDTGIIWINKHLDLRFDVPFGGVKQSGIGREQGLDGLREFTQAKIINIARSSN